MNVAMKGRTLYEARLAVEPIKLEELAVALGTETAAETATLVPFYGPTVAGEHLVVEQLEISPERALLAGISYEWNRPFESREPVDIRLWIRDVYEKHELMFAVLGTDIRSPAGDLIQTQTATFIERTD